MSLPEGYRKTEYIQSSGTQYIDTNFKPNQNSRIVVDMDVTANSAQKALFGSRNSDRTGFLVFTYTNNAGYQDDYGSSTENGTSGNSSGRHLIDKNQNVLSVDGEVIKTHTAATFTLNQSAYIFSINFGGSPMSGYNATAKLYSCQIYDNGTLARDFAPCINPSDEVGLYDMVEEQFFGNAGTGAFSHGEVIDPLSAPENFEAVSFSGSEALLSWDSVDGAEGYRLYAKGALLQETSDTTARVNMRAFDGVNFALTAFESEEESEAANILFIALPEGSPVPYLVIDRKMSDIGKNEKGYYSAADLNRVNCVVRFLAKELKKAGVLCFLNEVESWTDEMWVNPSAVQRYLANVEIVKNALTLPEYAPEVPESIKSIDSANNIEIILKYLDEHLKNMESIVDVSWAQNMAFCGMYAKEAY